VRRVLSLGDLLVIAAAAIGPAFVLATVFGPMVLAGGSATPLALVFVSIVMACIAIGYQRLGERSPNAGSSYSWVRTAFGSAAGAYAAWVLIVANVFAVVATAVPAGTYTLALFAPALAESPLAGAIVGTGWVLASGLLLYSGLRPTAKVTNVLLIAELAILTLGAGVAFTHPVVAHAASGAPFPGGAALIGAMVIGIWMIDGWEVSASTAEEAQAPTNVPGISGLIGLVLSAAVLWLCMLAFMRVGTLDGFALHEGDAMAYIGLQLGGNVWRIAIAATVLVSLAAALQTTLVYLTRSFYAMGRDGVLPLGLGALDRRAQPTRAIVLMTGAGMAFTLGSGLSKTIRAAFDFILNGTSVFLGILFIMSAAAAVRIFASDPARRISGVVLPAFGTLALTAILAFSFIGDETSTRAFIVGAAAAGVPLAVWRGRVAKRTPLAFDVPVEADGSTAESHAARRSNGAVGRGSESSRASKQ
jgi:amino acid transporter